jgi:hypothetical protein
MHIWESDGRNRGRGCKRYLRSCKHQRCPIWLGSACACRKYFALGLENERLAHGLPNRVWGDLGQATRLHNDAPSESETPLVQAGGSR